MSSKQISLLCLILGCVSLVCVGGVLMAGYGSIVSEYGIDAPFEDFFNGSIIPDIMYKINRVHETIRNMITIFEDGSFVGCIPNMDCNIK